MVPDVKVVDDVEPLVTTVVTPVEPIMATVAAATAAVLETNAALGRLTRMAAARSPVELVLVEDEACNASML
jgi:hypothetical protein